MIEEKILENYKDVIDFHQLKEILGISKNKLYRMLREQEIPNKKVGREYRILKANLIKYLQS